MLQVATSCQHCADLMEIAKLFTSRTINIEAKFVAENNSESEHSEVNMTFHGAVGSAAGKVEGDQKTIQHNYASEQKQTLADAAAEIQQLLKQRKTDQIDCSHLTLKLQQTVNQ